ncbi:MAG: BON domain-containing protein [Betaproteobacteria bacterium]
MNKLHSAIIALATALPLLQACVPIAVGVGAGATVLVATDRRTSGAYIEDEGIENKALSRINDKYKDGAHINVTSYNRTVLLTGEVATAEVKADIEKLASEVANVKSVVNEVQIAPITTMSVRTNDSYLTSKVKARFVDANKFSANHVKVVTEAGTVFLLGMVTRKEGDDATEIARTTGGVTKVVKLFEYIVLPPPPPAPPKPPEPTFGSGKI